MVYKYWMCQAVGKGIPNIKHATYALARKEAARLAQTSPEGVVILVASVLVTTQDSPVNVTSLEEYVSPNTTSTYGM